MELTQLNEGFLEFIFPAQIKDLTSLWWTC